VCESHNICARKISNRSKLRTACCATSGRLQRLQRMLDRRAISFVSSPRPAFRANTRRARILAKYCVDWRCNHLTRLGRIRQLLCIQRDRYRTSSGGENRRQIEDLKTKQQAKGKEHESQTSMLKTIRSNRRFSFNRKSAFTVR
jgi:hypothetical protein